MLFSEEKNERGQAEYLPFSTNGEQTEHNNEVQNKTLFNPVQ